MDPIRDGQLAIEFAGELTQLRLKVWRRRAFRSGELLGRAHDAVDNTMGGGSNRRGENEQQQQNWGDGEITSMKQEDGGNAMVKRLRLTIIRCKHVNIPATSPPAPACLAMHVLLYCRCNGLRRKIQND